MAFGLPTTLDAILDAISAKLAVTDELLDVSQVLPTLARDQDLEAMPMKDQFLAIRPAKFPIDLDRTGGGRMALAVSGTLELLFFARLWVGAMNNDYQALKNASFGVLTRWQSIMNSLEQFSPLNANGDCLLRQPMRVQQWDLVPRRTNKPGWTRLDSAWEIKFVQSLS